MWYKCAEECITAANFEFRAICSLHRSLLFIIIHERDFKMQSEGLESRVECASGKQSFMIQYLLSCIANSSQMESCNIRLNSKAGSSGEAYTLKNLT